MLLQVINRTQIGRVAAAVVAGAALCLAGCASKSPKHNGQTVFEKPEAAVTALTEAINAGDKPKIEALFGPDVRDIVSSGDPVADRHNREVLAAAFGQKWSLNRLNTNTREVVVGNEDWPFPIPLIKDARGWWFDTASGKDEVLARRIGRNELAAIGALRTYVLAQREYASVGRDGKPSGIYAQKLRSDPGMRNGLYWPSNSPDEPRSPLGDFAASARAEGYGGQTNAPAPYRGYHFRILTKQGAKAPGGAKDYIVNGEMTGGFAMVAYPADYLNSGIMTFLVGPDGVVYESDLGEQTAQIAGAMDAYNLEGGWDIAE